MSLQATPGQGVRSRAIRYSADVGAVAKQPSGAGTGDAPARCQTKARVLCQGQNPGGLFRMPLQRWLGAHKNLRSRRQISVSVQFHRTPAHEHLLHASFPGAS